MTLRYAVARGQNMKGVLARFKDRKDAEDFAKKKARLDPEPAVYFLADLSEEIGMEALLAEYPTGSF